jgi:hypothetical protein
MRTIILSFFIFTLGVTEVSAQLEKGQLIGGVSGNLKGTFSSSNDYFGIGFRLNPYALYLIEKNMALGLSFEDELGYARYNNSDGRRQLIRNNNLRLGPEFRKYFGTSKLMPFAGLSTGLVFQHNKHSEWSNVSNNFGFFLAPEAGFSFWLNDKTYFDFKARYDLINTNYPKHYRSLNVNFGIGFKILKQSK